MRQSETGEERRAFARVPVKIPISIHFKDRDVQSTETGAMMLDLSSGGMFVRCSRVPSDGQRILVGLVHRTHGLCAAWGRAVRFDGKDGFGVEFRRADDRLVELVRDHDDPDSPDYGGAVSGRLWIESASTL